MSDGCCNRTGYYPEQMIWTADASLQRGNWMPYQSLMCPRGMIETYTGCGKYATEATMYTSEANVSPSNTRTDRSVALSGLVEGFSACRGHGGEGDYARLHGTWTD